MIQQLIAKILKLRENDREINLIKSQAQREIKEATATIRVAGVMNQIFIQKTTTFYIAKAMGVIR